MGVGDGRRIDLGLRPSHAAGRFQPAHGQHLGRTDQPVAGRHRRAVVEQRGVADDDRRPVGVAHDDLEGPSGSRPSSAAPPPGRAVAAIAARPQRRRRTHEQQEEQADDDRRSA